MGFGGFLKKWWLAFLALAIVLVVLFWGKIKNWFVRGTTFTVGGDFPVSRVQRDASELFDILNGWGFDEWQKVSEILLPYSVDSKAQLDLYKAFGVHQVAGGQKVWSILEPFVLSDTLNLATWLQKDYPDRRSDLVVLLPALFA
mgnify:CR=1 FL=1